MDGNFNLVILGSLFTKLWFLSRFLPYLTKHLREFFYILGKPLRSFWLIRGIKPLFSLSIQLLWNSRVPVCIVKNAIKCIKKIKTESEKLVPVLDKEDVLVCCGVVSPFHLCCLGLK